MNRQDVDPSTENASDIVDDGRTLLTDGNVHTDSPPEQQKQPGVIFDDEYADVEYNSPRVFKARK